MRNADGNPELVVIGGEVLQQWTEVLSFCNWTFRLGTRPPLLFSPGGHVPDGSSAFYIFSGQFLSETRPMREIYHYDHKTEVFTQLERKKAEARSYECVLALDEV